MLRVALTCRMFLEVGLDLLWECLPDLECLLAIWEAYGVFSIDRRLQLSVSAALRHKGLGWSNYVA